ncbi:ABC transporter ATP-binding protein [Candidatus Poriferisodalis sp.]|uniref:ABC transporter ATP-binding protein n=1 Tax=Candidatus Poriferisodalis sp. TaxID=3101277 RepID=UPI003B01C6AD
MNLHATNLRRVHQRGSHDIVALDDVSLDIRPGEFLTVTGPSGSGKSTLLHLLGLIDSPTAGTLRIDGVDTATLSDDERSGFRRRVFGFVFQSFLLLPGLSAWENVATAELLDGRPLRTQRARALALLDEVGLADRWDHPPDELSGGEQQRVAIARSLMPDPQVVFADEPTGALDQSNSASILSLLRSLTVDRGRSLVVVTHEPAIATSAEARVLNLRDGRIAEGPVPA